MNTNAVITADSIRYPHYFIMCTMEAFAVQYNERSRTTHEIIPKTAQ